MSEFTDYYLVHTDNPSRGHRRICPALLLGAQKLARTLEFPNGPITTNFEIAHLDEAMRLLAGRCTSSN